MPLVWVHEADANCEECQDHGELERGHDVVQPRGHPCADNQQQRQQQNDGDRGQVVGGGGEPVRGQACRLMT